MTTMTATKKPAEARASSKQMVTGLFPDGESVEQAYEVVAGRGYGIEDVNVVMSDDTRRRYFSEDRKVNMALGRKSTEGGEMGGPIGATIGTILPAIIAVGAVALPGVGIFFAGPFAVALAAAGATGLTVGLIAALSDWGIPKERAEQYELGIHDGGILLGVRARSDDDVRYFVRQWPALGGQYVHA